MTALTQSLRGFGPYVSFCILLLNTSADECSPTALKYIAITEFTAGVDLQSAIVKENFCSIYCLGFRYDFRKRHLGTAIKRTVLWPVMLLLCLVRVMLAASVKASFSAFGGRNLTPLVSVLSVQLSMCLRRPGTRPGMWSTWEEHVEQGTGWASYCCIAGGSVWLALPVVAGDPVHKSNKVCPLSLLNVDMCIFLFCLALVDFCEAKLKNYLGVGTIQCNDAGPQYWGGLILWMRDETNHKRFKAFVKRREDSSVTQAMSLPSIGAMK